jgi:hypothetical protein
VPGPRAGRARLAEALLDVAADQLTEGHAAHRGPRLQGSIQLVREIVVVRMKNIFVYLSSQAPPQVNSSAEPKNGSATASR